MDIGAWLQSLGLEQYEAVFRANAVDAEVLPELGESGLEKLGVLLGHRKKLLKAIAALDHTIASASRKSFLWLLRKGITNCAGISFTSWPSASNWRLRWWAPTQASMPIRHGGILVRRASIWPRESYWRRTMAPRGIQADQVEAVLADVDP
jgi:hypothetical protein